MRTPFRAAVASRSLLVLLSLLAVTGCAPTTPSPLTSPAASAAGSPGASTPPSAEPETTTATRQEIDALREAALASVEAGTVRMVYTVQFEGATTVPDGTFLTGRGQTSFGEPRQAHLSADLRNPAFHDWELILEGRRLYIKGEVVSQIVPTERWLLVDLDSDHRLVPSFAMLASGQNDSSLALLYVLGATGDVAVGAGESIDGQGTTRYVLGIDIAQAREHLPASSVEALDDNIAALEAGGISPAIDAEVWVGRDGRVVKTRYAYTLGPGEGGGRLIGTYLFSDFGAPMDDVTPPDADVLALEDAVAD